MTYNIQIKHTKTMKTLWTKIQKAFFTGNVTGSCECGKYAECCRKIYINFHGKIWVETDEHFRCGKMQKQILKIKERWDN